MHHCPTVPQALNGILLLRTTDSGGECEKRWLDTSHRKRAKAAWPGDSSCREAVSTLLAPADGFRRHACLPDGQRAADRCVVTGTALSIIHGAATRSLNSDVLFLRAASSPINRLRLPEGGWCTPGFSLVLGLCERVRASQRPAVTWVSPFVAYWPPEIDKLIPGSQAEAIWAANRPPPRPDSMGASKQADAAPRMVMASLDRKLCRRLYPGSLGWPPRPRAV